MHRPRRLRRSLLAPIGWALACAGDPPAFPDPEPSTSGTATAASGDGPPAGATDGLDGSTTGGLTATSFGASSSDDSGVDEDGTSTGTIPPPVVCRDPDGLCHAPVKVVPLESEPGPIAAGDVNGDGVVDLVVVDAQSQIAVLLGDGDGTFAPPLWTPLAQVEGATDVVLALLDADDLLDLAITFANDDLLAVLRGTGRGGFEVATAVPGLQNPQWLADGDFDGDGVRDLVVAKQGDDRLGVLRGQPGQPGNFSELPDVVLGYRPTSVVVTEATGRALGLVVTSRLDGRVELLEGTGVGAFLSLSQIAVGSTPVHADVTDLNADGLLDLVTVHRANNSISVRLGVLGGPMAPFQSFGAIGGPQDAAIADMNLDGFADVVVCGDVQNGVAIAQGIGDGTFAAPVVYPSMLDQVRLVVADFDADGVPDVASTGQQPGGIFIVLSHAS